MAGREPYADAAAHQHELVAPLVVAGNGGHSSSPGGVGGGRSGPVRGGSGSR
jgi:hypothetical protein